MRLRSSPSMSFAPEAKTSTHRYMSSKYTVRRRYDMVIQVDPTPKDRVLTPSAFRTKRYAAMSPRLGFYSRQSRMRHPASMTSSRSLRTYWEESISPDCHIGAASATKGASTGRQFEYFKHFPYAQIGLYFPQGRWLSGVSALPIHPSLFLDLLPAHVLQCPQSAQFLPAHRRP